MPREINHEPGLNLDRILAPERQVFSPWFDFTLLLFRPLPIPLTEDKRDGQLTPGVENGEPGKWFGQNFKVAELRIFNKVIRYIIKHQADSDKVLLDSPTYHVSRYLRPYQSCLKYNPPEKSYYWPQIDHKLFEYLRKANFTFNVYDAAFVQAIVYVVQSTPQRQPIGIRGKSALILLKKNSLSAFKNAIRTKDPSNPTYDVVNLEAGKLVGITKAGADPDLYPKSGVESGSSYSAAVYDTYDIFKAAMPGQENLVLSITDHWNRVFNLPSPEEEIQLLEMSDVPAVIQYLALKDRDLPIPNSIVRQAKVTLQELGMKSKTKPIIEEPDEILEQDQSEDSLTEPDEEEDDIDEQLARSFGQRFGKHSGQTNMPDPGSLLRPSKWTQEG